MPFAIVLEGISPFFASFAFFAVRPFAVLFRCGLLWIRAPRAVILAGIVGSNAFGLSF